MIAVRVMGGLGNQMWQYACGRALAIQHGVQLKLDLKWFMPGRRFFMLHYFDIDAGFMTSRDLLELKTVKEKREPGYKLQILSEDNVYLDGYWQNIGFIKSAENIIRKDFVLMVRLRKHSVEYLEIINRCKCPVSVHVRRGDYLKGDNASLFAEMTPLYYETAVNSLQKIYEGITLFIFSNDISWCKKELHFHCPVYYVEGNDEAHGFEDLYLMSQCHHHIIANSSFSWWGAWLNQNPQKVVLAPEYYFKSMDGEYGAFNSDWLPEGWQKISCGYI